MSRSSGLGIHDDIGGRDDGRCEWESKSQMVLKLAFREHRVVEGHFIDLTGIGEGAAVANADLEWCAGVGDEVAAASVGRCAVHVPVVVEDNIAASVVGDGHVVPVAGDDGGGPDDLD